MSESPTAAGPAAQVGAQVAELAGWLSGLDPSQLNAAPAGDDWSVAETVAHVADFLTHWSDVVVAAAAHPGQPFGRSLDERDRYVLAHRGDDLAELLASLRSAGDHAQAQLASLPPDAWAATAVHARWGELALPEIVRRLLTDHLADHVEQARAIYARVAASTPDG